LTKVYDDLIAELREIYNLKGIERLLWWDQQTYMPPKGSQDRSLQMATLSTTIHSWMTSKRMGTFIEELQKESVQEGLSAEQKANVRETAWEYHRAVAVPSELVKELAKTKTGATQDWAKARERKDWSIFKPHVEKLLDLKKQEAEYIGYEEHPYDALMDAFEPGMRSSQVASLFSRFRDKLVPIVERIVATGIRPDTSVVTAGYLISDQERFNEMLLPMIGFDIESGRLDATTHPFTSGTLHDTRLTTRYNPDDLRPALFATIHEAGHGLYQQGHLDEHYGTPMGVAVSLGIHESQSRSWENMIGRSLPFWKFFFPKLREAFPKQLKGHTTEEFYAAINDVTPSLIRVEADEVTYNLHILLRFEIEMALFSGEIDANDAPQAWNERVDKFLGIEVPDDSQGVLQDIHWSMGAFGYFPTYTLGNLYAAQFFDKALKEMPDMYGSFEKGDTGGFLDWSRKNIHEKGKLHRADDLCREITGVGLDEDHFIAYLNRKFGPLYGF